MIIKMIPVVTLRKNTITPNAKTARPMFFWFCLCSLICPLYSTYFVSASSAR